MNVFVYVMKGKVANLIPYVIVFLNCFLWLTSPTEEVQSILGFYDFIIYAYYPIALWFYIQRIHRYYASNFVQIRDCSSKNIFFKEMMADFITILLYSLFITFIYFLIMFANGIKLLEYFIFFLQLFACYSLLIAIFHTIFLIKKNIKIAFIISYSLFLFMGLSDLSVYFFRETDLILFYAILVICLLTMATFVETLIIYFVIKKGDAYEIYYES